MKFRLFTILLFFCLMLTSAEGQTVKFTFQNGTISNGALRQKMETNLSKLLTEVNLANKAKRNLNYRGIGIDSTAARSLSSMWKNMHFSVNDAVISQRCLNQVTGYQVREISITLNPQEKNFEGSKNRELTVSFTQKGVISSVRLAFVSNMTAQFLQGVSVEDVNRRHEILAFVENFRNYYIEKNIDALEKIFAEDALIITGTVIKQKTMNSLESEEVKIKYRKEDKKQYIKRLREQIFARNRYINVNFDRISIERCGTPGKTNFYGVSLHQDWSTVSNAAAPNSKKPTYHDEGWLFLLWEFPKNGGDPIIHVRTWQPDEIILNDSSKINMHDFTF